MAGLGVVTATYHVSSAPNTSIMQQRRRLFSLLMQPAISIQSLNHYFGEGDLRKQVLFNINLECPVI
jgi:hypothetical protein